MLTARTEVLADGVTLHRGDCRDALPTLPRADTLGARPVKRGVTFASNSKAFNLTPGGRPPISETKTALLKMAFERGYGVSKAARESGVHRNTATAYYAKFRAAQPLPERKRGAVSEERTVRLHEYAWRGIGKRAAARGMTGVELAALILKTIADDNLFAAVLDDDADETKGPTS